MRRVCFTLRVDPERIDEYRRRHAAVWPEMLTALHDAGSHDYSLFLRDDGLLVGYFRTENLAAAQAAMEAGERGLADPAQVPGRDDVNRRWQAEMAPFFVDLRDGRPDRGMHVLNEVFNLEDQLGDL